MSDDKPSGEPIMNLYLISQEVNNDYDTYDSAVVCAENEDEARLTPPSGDAWDKTWRLTWVEDPKDVKVKLIGIADQSISKGVVLASYNAG